MTQKFLLATIILLSSFSIRAMEAEFAKLKDQFAAYNVDEKTNPISEDEYNRFTDAYYFEEKTLAKSLLDFLNKITNERTTPSNAIKQEMIDAFLEQAFIKVDRLYNVFYTEDSKNVFVRANGNEPLNHLWPIIEALRNNKEKLLLIDPNQEITYTFGHPKYRQNVINNPKNLKIQAFLNNALTDVDKQLNKSSKCLIGYDFSQLDASVKQTIEKEFEAIDGILTGATPLPFNAPAALNPPAPSAPKTHPVPQPQPNPTTPQAPVITPTTPVNPPAPTVLQNQQPTTVTPPATHGQTAGKSQQVTQTVTPPPASKNTPNNESTKDDKNNKDKTSPSALSAFFASTQGKVITLLAVIGGATGIGAVIYAGVKKHKETKIAEAA